MVEMRVIGLTVDNATKTPIVLLQDTVGQELLPIWVGAMEAMAISLALSGGTLPRPLTHDLMLNALTTLGGHVETLEITGLHEGTYYAKLVLTRGNSVFRVDCRPSDGIALVLRVPAPIRVSEQVLEDAAKARLRPTEEGMAHLTRPADTTTDMVRKVAERLEAEAQGTGAGVTLSPTADLKASSSPQDEDQKLADLLNSMEPESSRKM